MASHLKDNIDFPPPMAGGNRCFRVNFENCATIAIKGISLCFDFAYPGRDVYSIGVPPPQSKKPFSFVANFSSCITVPIEDFLLFFDLAYPEQNAY